jgi:hypothetical protein
MCAVLRDSVTDQRTVWRCQSMAPNVSVDYNRWTRAYRERIGPTPEKYCGLPALSLQTRRAWRRGMRLTASLLIGYDAFFGRHRHGSCLRAGFGRLLAPHRLMLKIRLTTFKVGIIPAHDNWRLSSTERRGKPLCPNVRIAFAFLFIPHRGDRSALGTGSDMPRVSESSLMPSNVRTIFAESRIPPPNCDYHRDANMLT